MKDAHRSDHSLAARRRRAAASRVWRAPRRQPQRRHDDGGPGVDRHARSAATRSTVESLAEGYQDPHFVEAKPSFMLKLHKADLLVVVGRELEIGWLPPLITPEPQRQDPAGRRGYLDASLTREDPRHADRADHARDGRRPSRWATRTTGSIRRTAAASPRRSQAKLSRSSIRPTRPTSRSAYADFDTRLAEAQKRWKATMAPYKGIKVVTYHRSWPNFAERSASTSSATSSPSRASRRRRSTPWTSSRR